MFLSVRKITELAGLAQSEVLVASFACAFSWPVKKSLGGLGAETCEQGSRGQRRREWQCLTATPRPIVTGSAREKKPPAL